MKKKTQKNCGGLTALFGAFVLAVLAGACANPLLQRPVQEPVEQDPGGSTGLRISIAAGEERTLLPAATFSKYEISFATDDSVTVPSDITLTGGVTTDIVPLDPADWTVTVTAYLDVEGVDVAAAEGSAQVHLEAGDVKGVPIRVSAIQGGGNGTFSYAVQYPADVTYGDLSIYNSSGSTVVSRSLTSQPSENGISLAPGYYRLRIYLNTSYSMAARTEIVHIYRGMETRADYVFTEADFGIPVEISGTVDLSGLGTVNSAQIILYRYDDFTSGESSFYEYNLSGAWSWTVRTLPFNQPTDLYMELRLNLSGGGTLLKRLPVPVSVHDQNLVAPGLGPFTVNRFDLSGLVDTGDLTGLGLTINNAWVYVYDDGAIPASLGNTNVNLGSGGSWSYSLVTEEASLPARIVLYANMSNGQSINDEIRTTLTANRSDLNFKPGPVSAGTEINGTSIGSDYQYLFVPDASGDYAFTLNGAGSQHVYLYLYNAGGSQVGTASGNPGAMLISSLTGGDVYYIQAYLNANYRDFQFRVDPVSQATLGGTVDLSGIPLASGVTINSATLDIYTDNSQHTRLGGPVTINTGDGAWSAAADLAGSSVPALFVVTANLSNSLEVNHQEYRSISGSDSGLNFSFAALTGSSPVNRATISNYDRFVYVPAVSGSYSLKADPGPNNYIAIDLYDAATGNGLYGNSGYGEVELIRTLVAEHPYLVQINSSQTTYQFRAAALQPATLSGTVSLSGLAPLTGADINSTHIYVYTNTSSPVQLGSTPAGSDGTWSLAIPASQTQAVSVEARIYLNSGRSITAHR
jgi:hypothetical protein